MTGIVLCGGSSTRMGSDKGLLPGPGGAWAQVAAQKLSSLGIPIALSIQVGQYQTYSPYFPTTELIPDEASLPVAGPLLGLLSVHRKKPEEDLLILACDMPMVKPELLRRLILVYRDRPVFEAYVYQNKVLFEPLCGLYTSLGLSKLLHAYTPWGLQSQSLQFALGLLKTLSIPIPPEEMVCFRNINTREDL